MGKKEIKMSFVAVIFIFIIILLLLITASASVYYMGFLKDDRKETETFVRQDVDSNLIGEESIEDKENQNEDNESIIKETEYIHISVLDENGQGLEYTDPVQIDDKHIIDYLVEELNKSEEINPEEFVKEGFINYEGAPILDFYCEDGSVMHIVGMTFSEQYDNVFVFYVETILDEGGPTYKLNSSIDLEAYIYDLYQKNK